MADATPAGKVTPPPPAPTHPTSFAAGRYQVKRFLGEGGKKKVYLAHDSLLDRDVAFALIKTDGLDFTGAYPHHQGGPGHGTPGLPSTYCDRLRPGPG